MGGVKVYTEIFLEYQSIRRISCGHDVVCEGMQHGIKNPHIVCYIGLPEHLFGVVYEFGFILRAPEVLRDQGNLSGTVVGIGRRLGINFK